MITLSSVLAGYTGIDRLLRRPPVSYRLRWPRPHWVAVAGNELVARYRIKVGRRLGSAALVADGLHARSEGFTSLAGPSERLQRDPEPHPHRLTERHHIRPGAKQHSAPPKSSMVSTALTVPSNLLS